MIEEYGYYVPGDKSVEEIEAEYPSGTRVEFVSSRIPNCGLTPGRRGTVGYVSCIGRIHADWDDGDFSDMRNDCVELRKI